MLIPPPLRALGWRLVRSELFHHAGTPSGGLALRASRFSTPMDEHRVHRYQLNLAPYRVGAGLNRYGNAFGLRPQNGASQSLMWAYGKSRTRGFRKYFHPLGWLLDLLRCPVSGVVAELGNEGRLRADVDQMLLSLALEPGQFLPGAGARSASPQRDGLV